jgi:hypothetical protein
MSLNPQTSRNSSSFVSAGFPDVRFAGDAIADESPSSRKSPLASAARLGRPRTFWPEPHRSKFGTRTKEKLECCVHDRVCGGTIQLSKVRKAFRN